MRSARTKEAVLAVTALVLAMLGCPGVAEVSEQQIVDYVTARVPELMEIHHIPGASVAIVHDGDVVAAEGFGLANVRTGQHVDEDTLFLLASTSKLFVATAVLQLVERGLIDLHTDVNEYLDTFRIPQTYPAPITLAHLLTHTAGFEEMEWLSPGEPRMPLGEYLATHLPSRVRAPGVAWAYSNYGIGLAAYIVERISGLSFAEYARRHIFEPLGMASTTYADPLPTELLARTAIGYGAVGGESIPVVDDVPALINLPPVGEAKSSASDMARYMLACLGNGEFDGVSILSEALATELMSPQFRMDERFAGMCYGFHERIQDDVRMIHHGGDSLTFHTELLLVPEENLGIFVAFNGEEGVTARLKFMMEFHDMLASSADRAASVAGAVYGNAERCAGDYLDTRRRYSGPEALNAWWKRTLTFEADHLGRLYRPQAPNARFVEVEPLVFEEAGGPRTIVFVESEQGEITHMFMPNFTTEVYERLPAWRTPRFVQQTIGAILLAVGTLFAALGF